jgi:hypothetical protein
MCYKPLYLTFSFRHLFAKKKRRRRRRRKKKKKNVIEGQDSF